jgi:hypothetical protein
MTSLELLELNQHLARFEELYQRQQGVDVNDLDPGQQRRHARALEFVAGFLYLMHAARRDWAGVDYGRFVRDLDGLASSSLAGLIDTDGRKATRGGG